MDSNEEVDMLDEQFARIRRDLTITRWMIVATMVLVYIRLLQAILVCE